jgi:hypothetical protein
MNVVLVHPEHGAKVAFHEDEIKHDEKYGWTRYNPDTPVVQPTEAAPVEEAPAKRKYTRRVTQQTIEQPNSAELASDESEGK